MLLNYHIGCLVLSSSCVASACKTNTTQNQPHQISNTQRTENKTTDVVIQQHSRKLLMTEILMSETCWAHKKWNKIASDIKLFFHPSTITMMHGPINIRFINVTLSGGRKLCIVSLYHPTNALRDTQFKTYVSSYIFRCWGAILKASFQQKHIRQHANMFRSFLKEWSKS